MFQDREGMDADDIRMIHHGKRLEDGRLLSDYNFGNSSNVLHLVFRLKSQYEEIKVSNGPTFVHVKEIKTQEIIPKIPVFNFPLMDPRSCEKIIQNEKIFSKNEITEMIESTVLPKFGISGEFDYDIFFVEYGFEKDNDFVLHTDPSKYTLNKLKVVNYPTFHNLEKLETPQPMDPKNVKHDITGPTSSVGRALGF
jgi:hypothetical protein